MAGGQYSTRCNKVFQFGIRLSVFTSVQSPVFERPQKPNSQSPRTPPIKSEIRDLPTNPPQSTLQCGSLLEWPVGFHPLLCYRQSFSFVTHCRHSPSSPASVWPLTYAETFASPHISSLGCHLLDSNISRSWSLEPHAPNFQIRSHPLSPALDCQIGCTLLPHILLPSPFSRMLLLSATTHTSNQQRERESGRLLLRQTASLPFGRILVGYKTTIPNAANCLTWNGQLPHTSNHTNFNSTIFN